MKQRIMTLALVLAFAVPASEAFASRAQELVLGTGDPVGFLNGGSFIFEDHYNFFYNPSYVNDVRNWGIIEKSNSINGATGTTAMGGFVTGFSNFALGLYMNRDEEITSAYGNTGKMRPIEVYVGGDTGVKWGIGAQFASFATPTATDNDIMLRAGVQVMNLDPFVWYKAKGAHELSAPGQTTGSIGLGARYHWGEWIPYAGIRQDKITVPSVETKMDTMGIGLARNTKVSEAVKMIYALSYFRTTEASHQVVPIDFSVEADTLSWLTLRAGLNYRVLDRSSGFTNNADATTGRIGATAHVGKADLNWAFGKANLNDQTLSNKEPAGVMDGQSFDLGDNLFSAVSLSYHW